VDFTSGHNWTDTPPPVCFHLGQIRAFAPHQAGFIFGHIGTDAPPQVCFHLGQIRAFAPHQAGLIFGHIGTDAPPQACFHLGQIRAFTPHQAGFIFGHIGTTIKWASSSVTTISDRRGPCAHNAARAHAVTYPAEGHLEDYAPYGKRGGSIALSELQKRT
jgi:hypothetical protein